MRISTFLPGRRPWAWPGSWASAARSTAMWSTTVLEPALPARSRNASGSPVPSGPWSTNAHIGWKPKPRLNVGAADSFSECAVTRVASTSITSGVVAFLSWSEACSPANDQARARAAARAAAHVVVDNLATHKHLAVRAWLDRHPRVRLHFTPTSGSWLNLIEAFFSIITRQALRRGSFPTVADLIAAIERFIAAWNDHCRPFTWTKDPDTVIAKATDPRHRKTPTASVTQH